ncbi:C10 family peptidase [Polaribacter sp. M15]
MKKFVLFYCIILASVFACSKDDHFETEDFLLEENFIELSFVKKISKEILFEDKKNINKSTKSKKLIDQKRTPKDISEVKNDKNKTTFYVINYNEGGYILLSADKRTQPILGFSEKGEFIVNDNIYPIGLKFWVKDVKKRIGDIQDSDIKQSKKNKLAWEEVQYALTTESRSAFAKVIDPGCTNYTETIQVGPLMSSSWRQNLGFNDALPSITCNSSNYQVLAGCVPIAMGQVMKFLEYPTNYNWSSMPLTTATTTTANFIKDIHNAIDDEYPNSITYLCGATGVASSANMGNVLKNQFNYSSADWANYNYFTVKTNLANNRPVILSGDNGSSGHMWVCEGYRQTSIYYDDCTGVTFTPLFYMNWGWGSSYDGYFSYNNFDPGNSNYNNNKKMIYNIIP